MNFDSHPFTNLVNSLTTSLSHKPSFTELKEELMKTNANEQRIYKVGLKENDTMAIVYYDDVANIEENRSDEIINLEKSLRSLVIDKTNLSILGSQLNKILYNSDALEDLKSVKWENIVVQKCYEGTVLMVLNHNDQWYVTTRRCLNASTSLWIRNKSYMDMFNDAIKDKLVLDQLNKNHVYYFVLLHHRNRNIVNYDYLGKQYAYLVHTMTLERSEEGFKEINENLGEAVLYPETLTFSSLDQLQNMLREIGKQDEHNKEISTEGFILKVKNDNNFRTYKLQTEIYQKLIKLKPNNSNIHQSYLELYQNDALKDYLLFTSKYQNEVINRINKAIKTVSLEVLNLYHATRRKQNPEVYSALKDNYKKVLYGLHGLYIENRKKDFEESSSHQKNKSITIHDVYHFIKNLPSSHLRQLFLERYIMLDEGKITQYLNPQCIYTTTHTSLMFRDLIEKMKQKKQNKST